jgi:hypothetical protein
LSLFLSRLEKFAPSFPVQLLVLTSVAIVIASVASLAIRVTLPYPINVWEAGLVTDAARMAQGLRVYDPAVEHATTMYSPLTTIVLSEFYKALGFSLQAGRWLNVVAASISLCMILAWFSRPRFADISIALAMLLAGHARAGNYFAESRPDMTAIALVLTSLLLVYRGLELTRGITQVAWIAAGSLLLAVAVFTKQTALAYAVVPPVAVLLTNRSLRRFTLSLLPFVPAVVGLIVTREYLPAVWHFMIDVPLQYRVPFANLGVSIVALISAAPLFLLALTHWLLTDAADDMKRPRIRWLMIFIACAFGSGVIAAAKEGGASNSLIPAFLGMGAFCAWRLPVLLGLLERGGIAWAARSVAAATLAFLLLIFATPDFNLFRIQSQFIGLGAGTRPLVIAEARELSGKVVSPDDPTLALLAKGYAGRSAVFQADAVRWMPTRIDPLIEEIASADWVILIAVPPVVTGKATKQVLNRLDWWPREEVLNRLGFKLATLKSTSDPFYQLWRKEK